MKFRTYSGNWASPITTKGSRLVCTLKFCSRSSWQVFGYLHPKAGGASMTRQASKPEYIHIECVGKSTTGKTQVFTVKTIASQKMLGVIKWYAPWRQYAFYPENATLFNQDCLELISSSLVKINRAHRENLRQERDLRPV